MIDLEHEAPWTLEITGGEHTLYDADMKPFVGDERYEEYIRFSEQEWRAVAALPVIIEVLEEIDAGKEAPTDIIRTLLDEIKGRAATKGAKA